METHARVTLPRHRISGFFMWILGQWPLDSQACLREGIFIARVARCEEDPCGFVHAV